ncbi:MAG: RebB family R body protein [Deltaproteobacteria bacterium]|nr:RebB family R body protein [Deltaproteobacteria bacterium]
MADEVNRKISSSISDVNTVVLGDAPAQAMATLYQTSAASAGLAMQNAVHAQNNQHAINIAATAEAIQMLFTSSTAASAAAATKLDGGQMEVLQRLTSVIEQLTGGDRGGGTGTPNGR